MKGPSNERRADLRGHSNDAPDIQAKTALGEGLAAYNVQHTDVDDRRDLAVLPRDTRTGEILGGILGRTSLGLLFIDLVFIPEAMRRHGLGSRMLQMAEEEGRARGCVNAVLYTISVQGPEFYAKHGWHEFGRIVCIGGSTGVTRSRGKNRAAVANQRR